MNIKKFQNLSTRTAPFEGKPSTESEFNFIISSYTLGLVGESLEVEKEIDKLAAGESNLEDVQKEIGDVFHYAAVLLKLLDVNYEGQLNYTGEKLSYLAGDFSEMIKKGIYHGHGLNYKDLTNKLEQIIYKLRLMSGNSLEIILENNIEKLRKRYPNKFNTADSIARKEI